MWRHLWITSIHTRIHCCRFCIWWWQWWKLPEPIAFDPDTNLETWRNSLFHFAKFAAPVQTMLDIDSMFRGCVTPRPTTSRVWRNDCVIASLRQTFLWPPISFPSTLFEVERFRRVRREVWTCNLFCSECPVEREDVWCNHCWFYPLLWLNFVVLTSSVNPSLM